MLVTGAVVESLWTAGLALDAKRPPLIYSIRVGLSRSDYPMQGYIYEIMMLGGWDFEAGLRINKTLKCRLSRC